jgi:diphthamide synthase (EF-2-diphthine--ammonia ligase)
MQGLYPVWRRDTGEFVREFIQLGYRAVVTCVDGRLLAPSFAGMSIDESFLSKLPCDVDPCGENGEFHTFVHDGPSFGRPVRFSIGETVPRDGFWFCDLLPEGGPARLCAEGEAQDVER